VLTLFRLPFENGLSFCLIGTGVNAKKDVCFWEGFGGEEGLGFMWILDEKDMGFFLDIFLGENRRFVR
jgi:hypothetical protein